MLLLLVRFFTETYYSNVNHLSHLGTLYQKTKNCSLWKKLITAFNKLYLVILHQLVITIKNTSKHLVETSLICSKVWWKFCCRNSVAVNFISFWWVGRIFQLKLIKIRFKNNFPCNKRRKFSEIYFWWKCQKNLTNFSIMKKGRLVNT